MRRINKVLSRLSLIASIFALSSCNGMFGKVVTYHKPCGVWKQAIDAFKSNDGKVYAFYDWVDWSIFKGEERANDCYYQNRYINGFSSNERNLFISTSKIGSISDCSIEIFDKDMNVLKQISSDDYISHLAVSDDSLYCLCGYDNNYFLKKYSLDNYQEVTIGDIRKKEILKDKESILYFSECCDLFFVDSEKHFHGSRKEFDCWDLKYGLIECQINNDTLIVSIGDEIYSLVVPYGKTLLYNNVYIKNGYLVFAIREYIDNNDCPPGAEDVCFCHFGRSSVIRFDLLHKKFLESIEYSHQSILIDYDFDGAQYYYNGALYDKENKIRDCKNIAIHGTKKMNEVDTMGFVRNSDEILKLLYYENEFYGI